MTTTHPCIYRFCVEPVLKRVCSAGVVTLVTFSTALCCLVFPNWVELSWSRNNFTVFLPLLVLGLIEVVWIAYGESSLLPHSPLRHTGVVALLYFFTSIFFITDSIYQIKEGICCSSMPQKINFSTDQLDAIFQASLCHFGTTLSCPILPQ